MTCDVLIDTDVLVYAYDAAAGEQQRRAIEILDKWVRTQRAAISAQVLSEFIVVAAKLVIPWNQKSFWRVWIDFAVPLQSCL